MPPVNHPFSGIARGKGFLSSPPTASQAARELYFSPRGHLYDRHRISLSDPVLVEKEDGLDKIILPKDRKRGRESVTGPTQGGLETSTSHCHLETGNIVEQGPIVSRVKSGSILRGTAGHHGGLTPIISTGRATGGLKRCWNAVVRICLRSPKIPVTLHQSLSATYKASRLIVIVSSLSISENSNSEHRYAPSACVELALLTIDRSKYIPVLAPLASEVFKEELCVRGYLKRPPSQPSDAIPHNPSASPVFTKPVYHRKSLDDGEDTGSQSS
ncbi:hypothetical protein BU15DRAFT_61284 [Melanogaster broomeanus]|nr:hypothetical protein BU15DRAFT_61284 [Melanogaster broomeanus]